MKWRPKYNRYWLEAKCVEQMIWSRLEGGIITKAHAVACISRAVMDAAMLTLWDGMGQEHTEAIAAYGMGGGLKRLPHDD